MTWLTVGGCPRSGTTALGAILNAHPDIALLHEYDQAHFFNTLGHFFREETRLDAFGDADNFELIPRRNKHTVPLARAFFREITGKDARVIGTKFPGAHLWPQPTLPGDLPWKQIHISRDPYAVVTSYAKKMLRENYPGGAEHILDTAIAHWVSAWNHAVSQHDNQDFLHLVYEHACLENTTTAEKVAAFLDVAPTLDFSALRSTNKSTNDYEDTLVAAGFTNQAARMQFAHALGDWREFARGNLRIGFPLAAGETIDFTTNGNAWKWPITGFYPAENHGRWIRGVDAEILFAPQFSTDIATLSVEVPWVFEPNCRPPIVAISVDGSHKSLTNVSLGTSNGTTRRFAWDLRNLDLRAGITSTLRLHILNPRNPHVMGVSQDDRDLSFMIKTLRIDPL